MMTKDNREQSGLKGKGEHKDCGCDDSALFRSSDEVKKGFVRGIQDFGVKEVEFGVINGMAIFEGDIALGNAEEVAETSEIIGKEVEGQQLRSRGFGIPGGEVLEGVAITGQRFRWPGGIVPWEVVSTPSRPNLRDIVVQAIRHWEQNTRLRFPERTAANAAQYPNFVSFQALDGCWSSVGMRGGSQTISLGNGCNFGQAVHEIGHAIGLWHEQSREDRARNVRIHWENIQPGQEHNFNQHITDGDDIGTYDFNSIMHYGSMAFSRNNQPTIETLGGQRIGQRAGLSPGDIAAVRALYPQLEPSRAWNGVQFSASLGAGQSNSWFTHSWPAHWFVQWTLVPTAPPVDGGSQIEWTLGVTRQADNLLKYFFRVRNLSNVNVSFEARYDVLGWHANAQDPSSSEDNLLELNASDGSYSDGGGPSDGFDTLASSESIEATMDGGAPSVDLIDELEFERLNPDRSISLAQDAQDAGPGSA